MPFPMKIQPVDSYTESVRNELGRPPSKSRLRKLFDRQLFPNVLRHSFAEKPSADESQSNKEEGVAEFEPSSLCLDKMVENFIEGSNEKPSAAKHGRNRCNCFNGDSTSSDGEFDVLKTSGESFPMASSGDACNRLKALVPCATVAERNLSAEIAKIVENNKSCKRKEDLIRAITDGLSSLGYDGSVCKSRWEKSSSYPAGEYEFINVTVEGERLLVDIDFRSEFAIARATGAYKSILHSLPYIFVGKPDRLEQIVCIVSEAARQSLRKKGMHVPPWRKAGYMRAKWLSPSAGAAAAPSSTYPCDAEKHPSDIVKGDLDLIFSDRSSPRPPLVDVDKPATPVVSPWRPPALSTKGREGGARIVTGLASLLHEEP